MSTGDMLEKGRTVLFLRGVLLESELCSVPLRRGNGGWCTQGLEERVV